ncbi:hypothetical protein LUZ62_019543 [Rhynchospora pubera]|uniref:Uncharacterized protein n=1 Tax=Rhynchospora pubera TaxID=906938 RepID=A0AAV8F1V3_9POAL|nr:hypothetical protein LUZ62_038633 [Rhynchospora pubera]KAJ4806977.1 hypothetical protein LUZ62_019543 [Rhynchospora pubera]
MERETRNHYQTRGSTRGAGGPGSNTATDRDLLLQWGNRKRIRCTKTQHRDESTSFAKPPGTPDPNQSDRRVLRRASPNNGRSLRNTEEIRAMRGTTSQHNHQRSNGVRGMASPDRMAKDSGNGGAPATVALPEKGSSSGSEGNIWPKFAISLTNKEKEEDFLVFKGSKLPQRPKKRAKLIQRTINLVSPGLWLCDLTLERYEVREKKVSKKLQRPRGLRAMQNMESDSE